MTPGTSPADEMADRILTASRDKVIEALPEVVDQAMRKTLPEHYTPETAAAIAAGMTAELSQPAQPERSPEVTRALAQIELDRQAAKDAGLYDARYEKCLNVLGEMFVEANDVDPVIDILVEAMVVGLAKEHGLRVARANESADDQLGGQIVVWRESGLVLLPHSMAALAALDQLRTALGEKAGE
jgi:hypothetical protein